MDLPSRDIIKLEAASYGALFLFALGAAIFVSWVIVPWFLVVRPVKLPASAAMEPLPTPARDVPADGGHIDASVPNPDGGDSGTGAALHDDEGDGEGESKPSKLKSRRTPANQAVLRLGPRHFIVRLAAFEKRYGKAKFGTASAAPLFEGGQMVGFKLEGVGRPLQRLGFREGDVVTAINDKPVTSPDAAFTAYAGIQNALPTTVTVRRRGGSMTLHYRIE